MASLLPHSPRPGHLPPLVGERRVVSRGGSPRPKPLSVDRARVSMLATSAATASLVPLDDGGRARPPHSTVSLKPITTPAVAAAAAAPASRGRPTEPVAKAAAPKARVKAPGGATVPRPMPADPRRARAPDDVIVAAVLPSESPEVRRRQFRVPALALYDTLRTWTATVYLAPADAPNVLACVLALLDNDGARQLVLRLFGLAEEMEAHARSCVRDCHFTAGHEEVGGPGLVGYEPVRCTSPDYNPFGPCGACRAGPTYFHSRCLVGARNALLRDSALSLVQLVGKPEALKAVSGKYWQLSAMMSE